MSGVRVWAPHATQVEVVLERTRRAMTPDGAGWWRAEGIAGADYDGRFSPARGRPHGRPVVGLPGSRFVGCLQNHDRIGNRARGERIAQLAGPRRAAIGAALVLTAPFVPLLAHADRTGQRGPRAPRLRSGHPAGARPPPLAARVGGNLRPLGSRPYTLRN